MVYGLVFDKPARAQVPYLFLIWQTLRAAPDNPMLLLEVPHVSLRLQWRAKNVDDVAHAAAQVREAVHAPLHPIEIAWL